MFQFPKTNPSDAPRSIHSEPALEDVEIWEEEGGSLLPRIVRKLKSKFQKFIQPSSEQSDELPPGERLFGATPLGQEFAVSGYDKEELYFHSKNTGDNDSDTSP